MLNITQCKVLTVENHLACIVANATVATLFLHAYRGEDVTARAALSMEAEYVCLLVARFPKP